MSKYAEALRNGLSNQGLQQKLYGDWPLSIADGFGAEEISDAFAHIATLEAEKSALPTGDGDGADSIWRDQMNICRLIAAAAKGNEAAISAHFAHQDRAVRFWAYHIASTAPSRRFVQPLQQSEPTEPSEPNGLNRRMLEEALQNCRRAKRNWWWRKP